MQLLRFVLNIIFSLYDVFCLYSYIIYQMFSHRCLYLCMCILILFRFSFSGWPICAPILLVSNWTYQFLFLSLFIQCWSRREVDYFYIIVISLSQGSQGTYLIFIFYILVLLWILYYILYTFYQ